MKELDSQTKEIIRGGAISFVALTTLVLAGPPALYYTCEWLDIWKPESLKRQDVEMREWAKERAAKAVEAAAKEPRK